MRKGARCKQRTSTATTVNVMVGISNKDFQVVKALLNELQRLPGNDTKSANIRRNAKRLRLKFDRKNNQL